MRLGGGNIRLGDQSDSPVKPGNPDQVKSGENAGDGLHHHELHENEGGGFHSKHRHPDGREEHGDHPTYEDAKAHMDQQYGQQAEDQDGDPRPDDGDEDDYGDGLSESYTR